MSVPVAAQLQTTSDIEELEQIAGQASIRYDTRNKPAQGWRGGVFGWTPSESILRAKVQREIKAPAISIESAKPEKPAPIIFVFSAFEATSYTELINGLRQKLAVLGIRYEDFDDLAGYTPGMTGKALGRSQVRRLGIEKLFDGLRAAGLRLRLEDDPAQHGKMVQRIAANYNPRQANQARPGNKNHARPSDELITRVLTHLSNNTRGGMKLLNDAAKKARSNWALHAHLARLGKG
jgi:hypothetical protein